MRFPLLDYGNEVTLVGAVFQDGRGDTETLMFPGSEKPTENTMTFLDSEGWNRVLLQVDTQETEVIARAADGKIAKAILRKSQRQIERKVQWEVFRRDQFCCRYCGSDRRPLTVDHVVTWESGGPSIPENLISACGPCNKKRGNMEYRKWLESPEYKKVSKDLDGEEKLKNWEVIQNIDIIPVKVHVPKR
jgi:5-methylcytosine-specific restriction endonuclease McrA